MQEQRRTQTTSWLIRCTFACAAAGTGLACNADADAPNVDFGVSKPIGRWELESAQARLSDAGADVVSPSERGASGTAAAASASRTTTGPNASIGSSTQSGAGKSNGGAAGSASGPGSTSNTSNPSSSGSAAANGGSKAGSGGKAAGSAAGSGSTGMGSAGAPAEQMPAGDTPMGVTSLAFNFTTEPVGGRYKPKNIGAVWISDSSGKLVKSLEVWAFIRLRYLTKYASARGSARPDVTASATLPNHTKPHMATWDLKDTSGATVAPGKYTLNAEVTDQDATGKAVSVDFDTSAGPMTLTPSTSTGFAKLEVVLK